MQHVPSLENEAKIYICGTQAEHTRKMSTVRTVAVPSGKFGTLQPLDLRQSSRLLKEETAPRRYGYAIQYCRVGSSRMFLE
jgi:hypothetical protein